MMRFHWQNLNDKPAGRQGSPLRHGRAWWTFGKETREFSLNWEWSLFRRGSAAGAGISLEGDEGSAGASIRIPYLFSLYVHLVGLKWVRALMGYDTARSEFAYHDGAFWMTPWGRDCEWRSDDPWWRRGLVWHWRDTFFGRQKYESRELEKRDVVVPMPEGSYKAVVTLSEDTWKRPRSPFTARRLAGSIEVPGGIPTEGKGENSWDCGEDAIYSLHTSASSVEETVAKLIESATKERRRHGTPRRIADRILATEPLNAVAV